jgi:predicted  nucleic acid-binding Zn-ribbon protein
VDRASAREHPGSPPLRAAPSDQHRLLDLQALDSRLDLLARRQATLPERAQLVELRANADELETAIVIAETEVSDTRAQAAKAEGDVEQVRARAARDRQRLDTGAVSSPRELDNLQHELESLARRQSDLEDVQLEVMQRLEDAQTRVETLTAQREQVASELQRVDAALREAEAALEAEVAEVGGRRAALAAQIDPDLLSLYERLRAQLGGVGAARLRHGQCEGCRLQLTSADLARFRSADPQEVLRCEECQRILVRTDESGL